MIDESRSPALTDVRQTAMVLGLAAALVWISGAELGVAVITTYVAAGVVLATYLAKLGVANWAYIGHLLLCVVPLILWRSGLGLGLTMAIALLAQTALLVLGLRSRSLPAESVASAGRRTRAHASPPRQSGQREPRTYAVGARQLAQTQLPALTIVAVGVGSAIALGVSLWYWMIVLALYLWLVWGAVAVLTGRVHERPSGLEVRAGLLRRPIILNWGEIESFEIQPQKRGIVRARMKDGRRQQLLGLDARMTTRWQSGQTDDIVRELNSRLEVWTMDPLTE